MERDDETGLYLMGARYYACWLGRWASADPMGIGADGPGLYNYTRGSPVTLSDPSGRETPRPASGANPIGAPPPQDEETGGSGIAAAAERAFQKLARAPIETSPPSAEATASSSDRQAPLERMKGWMKSHLVSADYEENFQKSTRPEYQRIGPPPQVDLTNQVVEETPGIALTLWSMFVLHLPEGAPAMPTPEPVPGAAGEGFFDLLSKRAFPDAAELGAPETNTGAAVPEARPSPVTEGQSLSKGGGAAKPPLKELDVARYGEVNSAGRVGDDLAGHEVLQNAWLKQHGLALKRGAGAASRDNPALLVGKDLHAAIGKAQKGLGLHDASKLRAMTAAENIELNAKALLDAGVPEDTVNAIRLQAVQHARNLGVY